MMLQYTSEMVIVAFRSFQICQNNEFIPYMFPLYLVLFDEPFQFRIGYYLVEENFRGGSYSVDTAQIVRVLCHCFLGYVQIRLKSCFRFISRTPTNHGVR